MRELLAEAAERWGTPLYVTDLEAAAANLAAYRRAVPDALIAYAVKANSDPWLLRRLVADGAGCEVVNAVELALALRAGCPGGRIVMNGIGKTETDLRAGLDCGALVNAESLDELGALLSLAGPEARIGLRLNPALDAETHPHLATGAADAKFGIALAELPVALDHIRSARLQLASLGAHIGSNIGAVEPFARLAEILEEAAAQAERAGLAPERLDVGGGVADVAMLDAWAAVLPPRPLVCEPGRSIVAHAGWLVTSVVRVQPRSSCTYLVVDAGMTDLLRPVLYGADHSVRLVAPGAPLQPREPVHLAGPVCEAGDVLARDVGRSLHGDVTRAGAGALLALDGAGAYGVAMASNYNGRLRPAEVVVEDGELRLSRRRETLEELVARDPDVR